MARRRIPQVRDDWLAPLDPGGGAAPALPVGTAAWFAWLANAAHASFAYAGPLGSFTARREQRQGRAYWYAYRRQEGRLRKEYLGVPEELTSARLASVAARLAVRPSARAAPPAATAPTSAPTSLPLLATKLFAPRPRPDLVARPRLLTRLDAGLASARCTLLAAPAGSGKTTLLAAWLAQLDRPVAWLALDERDQDAHHLLRYLITALQAALQTVAPTCGRTPLTWLDAPSPPSPEVVLTSLLNDLAALPSLCLLVLDDYHLVQAPAVHQALAFLLDHLPPTVHLVLATREDPPLPLPRLRTRGHLSEVRATDLRFTAEEGARFLGEGMGLRLADTQVEVLVERTEGWAAGLQLAGLALRGRADVAGFVAAFAGSHRLVADYLTAEVLERQSASVRRFLLATAVLERLCAPVCDALLTADREALDGAVTDRVPGGSDGRLGDGPLAVGDSQSVLEDLERANLFLIPLDDAGHWYRYHHLFADALRARLAREAGTGGVADLHRRASAWFGREGLLPEAIQHALAGGAVESAAVWIEALTPVLLGNIISLQTLTTWLAALPEPVVQARPLLCLGQAWLLIHRYELTPALAWVEAAARAWPANAADTDARRLRGAIAATRAYLAMSWPTIEPEVAQAWAEQALADLAPHHPAYTGASLSLGNAALAQGRTDQAEAAFATAASAIQAVGYIVSTLVVTGQQVSVQRLRGARRRALATGQAALAWAAERGHVAAPGVGVLSVVTADLLRDGNDLLAALPLASEGLHILEQYEKLPPLIVLASLSVAWLRLARGEVEAAAATLAAARPLVGHGPFAALAPLLDAIEAQVALARGDAAAALAWAVAEPVAVSGFLRFGAPIFAAGVEALGVTAARVLAGQGRAVGDAGLLRRATDRLVPVWQLAEAQGLGWLRLKVLILRALIADGLGEREAALAALAAAVAQAEPEGYVRPFVDEGAPLAALLTRLLVAARDRLELTDGASPAYLDTLLAAFPDRESAPADTASPGPRPALVAPRTGLVEPLTTRELDVLRRLAAGASNAEMARDLIVEQSTVKTHLIRLYGKLGVHSRTQAVARARTLGLLA